MILKPIEKERQCEKCHCSSSKDFVLPAITFNYLEDSPVVCERCLYVILTGVKVEWRKEIKKYINEEK